MSGSIETKGEVSVDRGELPLRDRLFRMLVDREPVTTELDLNTRLKRNEAPQTLVAAMRELSGSQNGLLLGVGAYSFETVLFETDNNPDKLSLRIESAYKPGTGYGHDYRLSIPTHEDLSLDEDSKWLIAHRVEFNSGSVERREYTRGRESSDLALVWELTQTAAGELVREFDRRRNS